MNDCLIPQHCSFPVTPLLTFCGQQGWLAKLTLAGCLSLLSTHSPNGESSSHNGVCFAVVNWPDQQELCYFGSYLLSLQHIIYLKTVPALTWCLFCTTKPVGREPAAAGMSTLLVTSLALWLKVGNETFRNGTFPSLCGQINGEEVMNVTGKAE